MIDRKARCPGPVAFDRPFLEIAQERFLGHVQNRRLLPSPNNRPGYCFKTQRILGFPSRMRLSCGSSRSSRWRALPRGVPNAQRIFPGSGRTFTGPPGSTPPRKISPACLAIIPIRSRPPFCFRTASRLPRPRAEMIFHFFSRPEKGRAQIRINYRWCPTCQEFLLVMLICDNPAIRGTEGRFLR